MKNEYFKKISDSIISYNMKINQQDLYHSRNQIIDLIKKAAEKQYINIHCSNTPTLKRYFENKKRKIEEYKLAKRGKPSIEVLNEIERFFKEGLTAKEIGIKLNRSKQLIHFLKRKYLSHLINLKFPRKPRPSEETKELKRFNPCIHTGELNRIHKCLLVLGVPANKIYQYNYKVNRVYRNKDIRKRTAYCSHNCSVYEKYSITDLRYMIKTYHRAAIKNNHPDHFGSNAEYDDFCKKINAARDKAMKILDNRCRAGLGYGVME